jgi:hypothetical protein
MEDSTSPHDAMAQFVGMFTRQQEAFNAQLRLQAEANQARLDAIAAKPPAARKAQPPLYLGALEEDLELWFFMIEQYYSDYFPQMHENSSIFVTMILCHLGTTPMNWYRQFSAHRDNSDLPKTWEAFKNGLRARFLPPDHEYLLREKLLKTTQTGSLYEYIAAFNDVLIQCKLPITPLEQRFYFQHGLRVELGRHLREFEAANLAQSMEIANRHNVANSLADHKSDDWVKTANCHRCK